MIRILGSVLFAVFFVAFQTWMPGEAHDVCEISDIANITNVPGYCYQRGLETCNTSRVYRHGCDGIPGNNYSIAGIKPNCSLCVTDDSACLTKSPCEDVNGVCVNNMTDCDKLPMEPSRKLCDGPDCFCCGDGCTRSEQCKSYSGYCIRKNATCSGTKWNFGCNQTMDLGLDHKDGCACCVPDSTICIPKVSCRKQGGTAMKIADCNGTSVESKSLGDDCTCCF